MRTLKRKNTILLVLAFLFALTCSLAVVSLQSAYANDTTTINQDAFEMVKGAQLALERDGLRYVVKMGGNVYNKIVTSDIEDDVKLSFYVTTKAQLDALSGEDEGKYEKISKKIVINVDEEKIYQNSGYYYANAVVTNLNKENNAALTQSQFDYQFVGIGVIIDNSAATPEYTYAAFNDGDVTNNVRSQYQLLQSAMLDYQNPGIAQLLLSNNSPYKSWFGTSDYPLVIDTLEKHNGLVNQINNGVEYTIDVEISGDIDKTAGAQLEDGKTLPTDAKTYHYVTFYNGSEKLDTVKVFAGESATFSGSEPTKADGFYTYEFANAWTTTDGGDDVVNLDEVNASASVYAKFNKTSPRTGDDANTVFFFGEQAGLAQVIGGRNVTNSNLSVDTQKKADGMLKISVDTTSASKKFIELHYNVKEYAFNDGDTVSFEVYVDLSEDVEFIELYWGYTRRTRLMNKEWGIVVVEASHLNKTVTGTTAASDDQIRIYAFTNTTVYGEQGEAGAAAMNGSIYFGKAKAHASADVKNIYDSGIEYTFGSQNIEYVSGTSTNLANTMGCTLGNWTPNDGAFNQYGDKKPQIIDGTMRFYMQGSTQQTPILALIPKKAMKLGSNAKMHVTIRGNIDCLWFWGYYYSSGSGAYKAGGREGNSTSTVEKLDNGYTRYTLNYNSGWAGTTFEEFFIFLNNNQKFLKPNYRQVNIVDITFDDVTWVDKA